MKPTSLRKRFFINSAIVIIAVMVLSACLIDISYRHELKKSELEKLKLHVFNLLSVSDNSHHKLTLPTVLSNPKFNTPDSELWALVLDQKHNVIWTSLSMEAAPQNMPNIPALGEWQYSQLEFDQAHYFTASYTVQWLLSGSKSNSQQDAPYFTFVAAQKTDRFYNSIQTFRAWLTLGFILFSLSLLSIQFFVLKFSFKPINMLGQEIKRLESAQQDKLHEVYPKELASVTRNLNMLIDKEHKQREKYRAAMADLAHSLKTPISIITAEVSKAPENKTLNTALVRINDTIEYQLRRAVISGHNLLSKGTNVAATLDMVLNALKKIYRDKHVDVTVSLPTDCQFMGDENDLLEVFGNLLDNAFKHAHNKIEVHVYETDQSLTISIEDDGKGIPKEKAHEIFQRGNRLDETLQGQGIGLSIVENIASSYGAHINLEESKLGGALFSIHFKLNKKREDS
jgi:two-component system sensor histidine kinase PhoQ